MPRSEARFSRAAGVPVASASQRLRIHLGRAGPHRRPRRHDARLQVGSAEATRNRVERRVRKRRSAGDDARPRLDRSDDARRSASRRASHRHVRAARASRARTPRRVAVDDDRTCRHVHPIPAGRVPRSRRDDDAACLDRVVHDHSQLRRSAAADGAGVLELPALHHRRTARQRTPATPQLARAISEGEFIAAGFRRRTA